MKVRFLGLFFWMASVLAAQTYHLTQAINLGGSGGWDYLYADSDARRLYVSHSSQVFVIDLDSKQDEAEQDHRAQRRPNSVINTPTTN